MKFRAAVVSTALVAMTLSGTVRAHEPEVEKTYPSKPESAGMLGGAGIGALAGGPFGLVIGMALGGWIGDRMDTQKRTAKMLAQELEESKRKEDALAVKLEASDRAVEALSLQLEASREKLAQVNERS